MEEKQEKTLNKSGDKRGKKENNKQNFANNPEAASKAGKKGGPRKSVSAAITQAQGLTTGRRRITPETQKYIRDEMFLPDANGVPFIHQFIHNFMVEAKTDPNSQAARILANTIFKEDMMTTLDAQLNAQMAKDSEFIQYRIRKTLYDKQQEVYDDNFSKVIECICTRRAGKTELVARLLVREAIKPDFVTPVGTIKPRNAIYLNRTFDNAVGQMGKPVTELLDSLGIKYTGSPGSGKITLEGGATINFGGYNNKGDIDKFRGFSYSLICIDEIAHLRNPSVLFKETLEPALKDYGSEGRTVMTGTPPRTKANYAYQLWHNPNVTHYHWSFIDNVFIPEKDKVIEDVCKEHGVTVDAPFIQREYFGNLEAFDLDAMIFRGYKTTDKIPDVTFDHAYIGLDFGYTDAAAVVSCLAKGKQLYVVKTWSESQKSISDICNVVKEHINYIKSNFRLSREPWVIADTNEKGAIYELYQTYKIPNCYCAYKYDKDVALDQLAEWLRNDTVLTLDKQNDELIKDFENSVWKRDEETDNITHEVDDEEYHGNAMYALLYASRQFDFDCIGTNPVKSAKSILEGRDDID